MRRRTLGWILGTALISTAAWAFPWDTDMSDAVNLKPYEWKMMSLPEGTVARKGVDDLHNMVRMNATPGSPEGKALTSPYGAESSEIETGKRVFEVYCQTCHGVGGEGGAPVADNNPAEGKRRFLIPIPKLVGPEGRAPARTDGEIYLALRNGKGAMPAYSWALTEREMWAVVSYTRTLPGGAYVPPPTE